MKIADSRISDSKKLAIMKSKLQCHTLKCTVETSRKMAILSNNSGSPRFRIQTLENNNLEKKKKKRENRFLGARKNV